MCVTFIKVLTLWSVFLIELYSYGINYNQEPLRSVKRHTCTTHMDLWLIGTLHINYMSERQICLSWWVSDQSRLHPGTVKIKTLVAQVHQTKGWFHLSSKCRPQCRCILTRIPWWGMEQKNLLFPWMCHIYRCKRMYNWSEKESLTADRLSGDATWWISVTSGLCVFSARAQPCGRRSVME